MRRNPGEPAAASPDHGRCSGAAGTPSAEPTLPGKHSLGSFHDSSQNLL